MTVAEVLTPTRQQLLPKKQQIMQFWNADLYGKCTSVGTKITASQIKGVQFSDDTIVTAALLINASAIYNEELSRRNGNGAKETLKNMLQSYTQVFTNISQEKFNAHMQECINAFSQVIK